MAHAWKACWCNSLTSSNLVSSARIGTPETVENIRFPGFALVPSDCRFPPGSLRVDTFGPDLPRVSHIGTDDSENAFEPSPAACPPSKPDPPHASRQWADSNPFMFSAQFFRFGSQQSQPPYRKRIAANTGGRPSVKVPPDPSDERHTNAYGCHESPSEPSNQ